MSSRPALSLTGRLARLGFADPPRAERLLDDPALSGLIDPLEDRFDDGLLVALARTADPDLALLALVRLMEALRRTADQDSPAQAGHLRATLRAGGAGRQRLLAVLGASAALGDHLARHPEHWLALRGNDQAADTQPATAQPATVELRADLLRSVGADPDAETPVAAPSLVGTAGHDALRVAYRRRLLSLAGRDLVSPEPSRAMPHVANELADLAAAALEAALAISRAELPTGAAPCRIAVIGMGKCGGRELNYVSDVDVIYVVEPKEPEDPDGTPQGDEGRCDDEGVLDTGVRLAAGLARACSAVTSEGTLWPVDVGLRPEGKSGPLVRTLASHVAYYQRWAKTWEFQALLKARPVAGDLRLGERYVQAVGELVWRAAEREGFVEDVQAMRRRVEQHVPTRDGDRQLKLGPGGLRDVEFSVQLLQLVHGRADDRLRSGGTLEALEALSTYGYVGRDDAADLDRAYRFLRSLEHRIQLYRLRRTHVVPRQSGDLRRLGRTLGWAPGAGVDPAQALTDTWQRHALQVRRLHEKLFYRPLLTAAARLSTDEVRLSTDAARARLSALGYRDPAGAMRHLEALTSGVSRRAAIQRQLLPVLLGWFADGADPDAGLLTFRRVSEELGSTHWYLKSLRDSGAAAERLAHVLSAGRYAADLLQSSPEAVAMMGEDAGLAPRAREELHTEALTAAARQDDPAAAVMAIRGVRRRELLRTAVADLVDRNDLDTVGTALTDAAAAVISATLEVVSADVARRYGGTLPTRLLVVGMGRLGGCESGYASDADVLFVHDPLDGADDQQAQEAALAVVSELRRLLAVAGPAPAVDVDADLRPEGRNGPLVRSLDSYAAYYRRWSLVWEAQALLRAVPIAGDEELAARFTDLIGPVRWPSDGLGDAEVREIRRVKARVEAERLPRGADPRRHLKLGRGGLADVEWTAQLLALRHAGRYPALRTPSTVAVLRAAAAEGLVGTSDAAALEQAWRLASRVRNAGVLWRGRGMDSLPTDRRDLDGVARIVGYPPSSAARLEEDYQRTARRARGIVERVFYS